LYRFLTDPAAQVDTIDRTHGWINFDRVFFEPGRATLTRESMKQLTHIARILKAYPKARIRIGGYTDSTGAYSLNRHLSEARARTAWSNLVEMGINPARLEARGYGPRYAVANNDTEIGRSQNRRLSLRVVNK
jgi:outer membrane protein OmpA-like peptidoglycan-associated protein